VEKKLKVTFTFTYKVIRTFVGINNKERIFQDLYRIYKFEIFFELIIKIIEILNEARHQKNIYGVFYFFFV